MAAYNKVEVSLNTNAVEVGIPSPQTVNVVVPTIGPQGPQGIQGPQGEPGEVSGSIAWDNVTDKPSTFAPSAHTHTASEITDFTSAVEAASPPADWDTLANKPASFTPSSHTHGNLSNDGKIGSTSGLPLKTGTDGVVEAGAFGTSAGEFCEGDDSRLSDARTPTTHASTHHTGGTDAIAPNEIGAAYALVASGQFITGNTLLSSGRNRRIELSVVSTANVDLPYENNANGDIVSLVKTATGSGVATIRAAAQMSGGVPLAYQTLGTLSATDQSLSFVSDGTATGWSLRVVDTHTHDTADITSGTLAHERGGLEADVSAYDGLLKISGGSTSAVTVTSAGEALLDDADAAAQRTTLGLGTAATVSADQDLGTGDAVTFDQLIVAGDTFLQGGFELDNGVGTSNINTAATDARTLSLPDASGTIALTDDIPDPSSATPQALGTAAAGTSDDYSRADHVHGAPALNDLSNVSAAAPSDNDVLVYDNATSTWVAEAPAAGGGGGTKTYAVFTPDNNQPPASNYATLDTRNSVACLEFDDTTDESAVFVGIIPEGASLGSGLKIRLHWAATSATSGDCVWLAALERMNTDLDSDSFDTAGTVTTTCNGTSGIVAVSEITLTNIDSVTAGDGFRLKITRDADSGSDTLSGDVELVLTEVRSAA